MAPRETACYREDCLQDRVRGTWWCKKHIDAPNEPEQAHPAQTGLYRAVCFDCGRGGFRLLDAAQAGAAHTGRCPWCGGGVWLERDFGVVA